MIKFFLDKLYGLYNIILYFDIYSWITFKKEEAMKNQNFFKFPLDSPKSRKEHAVLYIPHMLTHFYPFFQKIMFGVRDFFWKGGGAY